MYIIHTLNKRRVALNKRHSALGERHSALAVRHIALAVRHSALAVWHNALEEGRRFSGFTEEQCKRHIRQSNTCFSKYINSGEVLTQFPQYIRIVSCFTPLALFAPFSMGDPASDASVFLN